MRTRVIRFISKQSFCNSMIFVWERAASITYYRWWKLICLSLTNRLLEKRPEVNISGDLWLMRSIRSLFRETLFARHHSILPSFTIRLQDYENTPYYRNLKHSSFIPKDKTLFFSGKMKIDEKFMEFPMGCLKRITFVLTCKILFNPIPYKLLQHFYIKE